MCPATYLESNTNRPQLIHQQNGFRLMPMIGATTHKRLTLVQEKTPQTQANSFLRKCLGRDISKTK